jgi:hypothetical protein
MLDAIPMTKRTLCDCIRYVVFIPYIKVITHVSGAKCITYY